MTESLRGKFLVATPNISDKNFERSVVFITEHNSKGINGFIINNPIPNLDIDKIKGDLGLDKKSKDFDIYFGGPVEKDRVFTIFSGDYKNDSCEYYHHRKIGATSGLDALAEYAKGKTPKQVMVLAGFSGWVAGQLETEIHRNDWIIAPFDEDLLLNTDNLVKWKKAAQLAGIDITRMLGSAGHA